MVITVTSFLGTSNTFADQPRKPSTIVIDSIWVQGNCYAGNTATLKVNFHSDRNGDLLINFGFPDSIRLLSAVAGQTEQVDSLSIVKDSIYTKSYSIKVNGVGFSYLLMNIKQLDVPQSYEDEAGHNLAIDHRANWDTVLNSTDSYNVPCNCIDESPQLSKEDKNNMRLNSSALYNVSVSGTVRVKESDGSFHGLPGVEVALMFRRTNPDSYWAMRGHFAVTDINGNYSFNDIYDLQPDIIANGKIRIIVGKSNIAAFIRTGASTSIGPFINKFFAEQFVKNFTPDGNNINLTYNIDMPDVSLDYAPTVLRYMYMSREFSGQYAVKPNQIDVEISPYSGIGAFRQPDTTEMYIKMILDPVKATKYFTVVAHEYGHYFQWSYWGNLTWSASNFVAEGWAGFFSFATRSWAKKNYGDVLESDRANTEDAPFQFGNLDPSQPPIRYHKMNYAGNVGIWGVGCLLWNCYDSYYDHEFESALYGKGDNDDVNGMRGRVFEIMVMERHLLSDGWVAALKENMSPHLQASIDKVWDFCRYDRLKQMRPAQLEQLSGLWCQANNSITLKWKQQHYISNDPAIVELRNWEVGYKVEYLNTQTNTWDLIGIAGQNKTSYSFSAPGNLGVTQPCPAEFRVTAFNNQGNSFFPQEVMLCPVSCVKDNEWIAETAGTNNNTNQNYKP